MYFTLRKWFTVLLLVCAVCDAKLCVTPDGRHGSDGRDRKELVRDIVCAQRFHFETFAGQKFYYLFVFTVFFFLLRYFIRMWKNSFGISFEIF